MSDKHYLQAEFEELMRDPATIAFLDRGALDGLWYWDLENPENEWMSPNFWRTFGFDPATKKHLASEWQHLIYPEDGEMALQTAQEHFANPDVPYDQLVRYKTADGGTVTVRCRGMAIFADGVPKRMLGAHTVVDDTRETEIERRLSSMLETSGDSIIAWSTKRGVLRWNQGAHRLYGIGIDQALGLNPNDVTEAHYAEGWTTVEAQLAEGRQWVGDVVRRQAEGREVITSTRLATVSYSDDDIIVLQIDRDVTQERHDQEFSNLVLEAGDMGAFELDIAENKLFLDRNNKLLLGIDPGQEIDNKDIEERIDPQDLTELQAKMTMAMTERSIFDAEYRISLPDGGQRWIGVRGQFYDYDKEGTPAIVRGVNWDASQTYAQKTQLKLMNRELNHRVRNLFSIVLALISMTSRNQTDPREMAESLRLRILALSSAHAVGMNDDESVPVPFRTLIDTMLTPFAGSKSRIVLDGGEADLPHRMVTPVCLILHELSVNAAKHGAWSNAAPDGVVSVSWRAEIRDECERLVVRWRESNLRETPDLEAKVGFGTRLIHQSLRQLGAQMARETGDRELSITLDFDIDVNNELSVEGF